VKSGDAGVCAICTRSHQQCL